jgi:two-component system, NarL family, nitrate/nitrite response regulator NarL
MSLLICSTNETIRERWRTILGKHYTLLEAATHREIGHAAISESTATILLHRSMVSFEEIGDLARTPLMVFADVPDDREAVLLFRRGILGYANTYLAKERLLEAVQTVQSGRVWIGRSLMRRIIRGATHTVLENRQPIAPINGLSEREWQIANLVGVGQSNLEIAADLDITERTVKAHIGSIFKKTKTASRLQLALLVRDYLSGSSDTTA